MTLTFYNRVAKGLKLNVRKFCGLSPTFVEVKGEKLVGGDLFCPPPILNRVKGYSATSVFFRAVFLSVHLAAFSYHP